MKKNITSIMLIALLILNIISLYFIVTLQNNVENLKMKISTKYITLQDEISSVKYSVPSALEEKANILDKADWQTGKLDSKNMTVPLIVSVIPKETTDSTSAVLTINNKTAEMTRDGVVYKASIPVSIFENIDAYVTFSSEDTQRSQHLDIYENLLENSLIAMYAYNNSSINFNNYTKKYTFSGNIEIDLNIPENDELKSLKIVSLVDDVVIQEKTLEKSSNQTVDYNFETKLSPNQTLETAVVATDSYGLTYRTIVDRDYTGSDTSLEDDYDWIDAMMVFDKNGKLIYNSMSEAVG